MSTLNPALRSRFGRDAAAAATTDVDPAEVAAATLGPDDTDCATVVSGARGVGARRDAIRATSDDDPDPPLVDALGHEPVAHGRRALRRDARVLLVAKAVVGMAFDGHTCRGLLAEPFGLRCDHGARTRPKLGAPGGKEDAVAGRRSEVEVERAGIEWGRRARLRWRKNLWRGRGARPHGANQPFARLEALGASARGASARGASARGARTCATSR